MDDEGEISEQDESVSKKFLEIWKPFCHNKETDAADLNDPDRLSSIEDQLLDVYKLIKMMLMKFKAVEQDHRDYLETMKLK